VMLVRELMRSIASYLAIVKELSPSSQREHLPRAYH
jgi:hypothetical protein